MTLLPPTAVLETERLCLRAMETSDLEFFMHLHQDPEVTRYLGGGKPRPPAETEDWFEYIQGSYRTANLGQLIVIRKGDGVRLGRCGLTDSVIERTVTPGYVRKGWFFSALAPAHADLKLLPELGYTFAREYWGNGYASEAARCVYKYVQENRPYAEIMSVIHPDNEGSLSVVSKFGVKYVEVIEFAGRQFARYDWPVSRKP